MSAPELARRAFGGDNRLFPGLAAGFAVLAGLLVYAALQQDGRTPAPAAVATVPRVVAAEFIPARTRLTPGMLEIRELPNSAAVRGAFTDVNEVAGLVTRYPIAANEQVSAEKVGAAFDGADGADSGLSFVVPPGRRAVAIEVTEKSAVGGLLIAGDRVDVIALFGEELAGIEKAVTVLQDVPVLAVAQVAERPVPPSNARLASGQVRGGGAAADPRGVRPVDAAPQPDARTVTLSVTPSDAQLLALAGMHGTLWLSLRGYEESGVEPLTPSDLRSAGVLTAERRNERP